MLDVSGLIITIYIFKEKKTLTTQLLHYISYFSSSGQSSESKVFIRSVCQTRRQKKRLWQTYVLLNVTRADIKKLSGVILLTHWWQGSSSLQSFVGRHDSERTVRTFSTGDILTYRKSIAVNNETQMSRFSFTSQNILPVLRSAHQ